MHNSKKFLAIIVAIFTLTGIPAVTQDRPGSIRGTVTSATTGLPVPDVLIFLEGENIHSTSGEDGSFELSLPRKGIFQLKASCIGYKPFFQKIDFSGAGPVFLEIKMEQEPQEIGQVSIIREKRDMEILNTPSLEPLSLDLSTTIISLDDIQRSASKTVIEAMTFAPGALIETRGRKVKQFFSVRGQMYPYPEYAINGVWQREFHETPYFFSTSNVERIEIIRSGAALMKGMSGMAGIINIVTKKYTEPRTTAELEYGTFNTLHTALSHGGKKKSFSYLLNLGYDHTDGPPGLHAAESMINAFGTLEWAPGENLTITANVFHLNGKRQFMKAHYPASMDLINRLESYDPFISSSISLKALLKQKNRSSFEVQTYYTDRRPEYVNEVSGSTQPEHDFEVGLNMMESITLGSSNILRIGALYNHWDAPNGKRFYVGRKSDLHSFSGVVADEQKLGNWNLNAGLRWVKTYIDEFGAFSIEGSGGPFRQVEPITNQWEPGVIQLAGGAVYNLRTNSMFSLNAVSGAVKPREGALDGDLKTPENEKRTMLDAGFKQVWAGLSSVILTGFYVNQDNAIIYSGETLELEPGRIVELYENQDKFQYGIELEANTPRIFRGSTHGFLNLTGMKSMVRKAGEIVENPELPRLIANTGLTVQVHHLDLNVFGNYVSSYTSSRFADPAAGQVGLGANFRMDINLGYSFGRKDDWRVYCLARNLTDVRYSTVVGYPDPGRILGLGIQYQFNGRS